MAARRRSVSSRAATRTSHVHWCARSFDAQSRAAAALRISLFALNIQLDLYVSESAASHFFSSRRASAGEREGDEFYADEETKTRACRRRIPRGHKRTATRRTAEFSVNPRAPAAGCAVASRIHASSPRLSAFTSSKGGAGPRGGAAEVRLPGSREGASASRVLEPHAALALCGGGVQVPSAAQAAVPPALCASCASALTTAMCAGLACWRRTAATWV